MSQPFSLVRSSQINSESRAFRCVRPGCPLPTGKWGLSQPPASPHMMMRGSGTDSPIDLWGSTLAPLR